MTKKTTQEVAAYIRNIVKKEIGSIHSVRKISEGYHWYVGTLGSVGRRNAWRYKYYIPNWKYKSNAPVMDPENQTRLMDAYKLINGMAPKLKELFGYTVVAEFSKRDHSLIYRVTPTNK